MNEILIRAGLCVLVLGGTTAAVYWKYKKASGRPKKKQEYNEEQHLGIGS